jgi:threonine dehydratase
VGDSGAALIPPFDHFHVIAGQGTAARELIRTVGALDYLYVPVGGGGLLAGSALAAAALSPGCRVIGVEPAAGDDVRQSLAKGERVAIPVPKTIADGAQTTQVGALTFPIIQRLVHEVMVVDDGALRRQMHFFLERMKMLVEPTGCLAAAAALASAPKGARVGIIVSGGNVDVGIAPPEQFGPATARVVVS